ncbi:aldehyde dehydrogenase family protein [Streptomyces sp. NBC_01275]|uniref:aldehyde dehydrogenase family protein n=1 Tax=Streptomyces sp. NBC_01275 TaxID=2903807 RepID=UPI00225812A7|nr:aldehyde dehydrogenase family protein [Streptomyces sp. NBC_01275]MCX4764963.1 aldehyde dehydrogenase family protein [Streptomyces sp. NBC_01275]
MDSRAEADGRADDETGPTAVLLRNRTALLAALETVTTASAAADEFDSALAALRGARAELDGHRPRNIAELGVFLPSNNILYSYALFALIPSLYASHIVVRPSRRVGEESRRIHHVITSDPAFPARTAIELTDMTQRQFIARCAESEAVVFNGRPENAREVGGRLPDRTLFLSFGSGPNPIVVGRDAVLPVAAQDIVRTRMHNSGQDCLCPDVVFAHDEIADDLLTALREAVRAVPVGPLSDPATTVGPLCYPDAVEQTAEFLAAHRDRIREGGRADRGTGLIRPTLLDLAWDDSFLPPEFFAPVVCVMRYPTGADVVRWLNSPTERRRGMYVSVYGEPALHAPRVGASVTLDARTALDAENGNEPLGGYGPDASHVRHHGALTARPLLLSAELAQAHDRGPERATSHE